MGVGFGIGFGTGFGFGVCFYIGFEIDTGKLLFLFVLALVPVLVVFYYFCYLY